MDAYEDDDDGGGGKMPAAPTKNTSVSCCIQVKTRFGQCYTRIDPPTDTTVGDTKKWLVDQNRFFREEEHGDFVHFIHTRKRILLKDNDVVEYDAQGLCELYVAFGTDPKQTGALGVTFIHQHARTVFPQWLQHRRLVPGPPQMMIEWW